MHRSRISLALIGPIIIACGSAPSPSTAPDATARQSTTQAGTPAPASSQAPAPPPTFGSLPESSLPTIGGVGGWPFVEIVAREDSSAVFGPDGTVYFLTGWRDDQNEYQGRLVALDVAGKVKPGWPIDEPIGSDFGSPAVGRDGSVSFEECKGPEVGCKVHRLDESGLELPGWPLELPAEFACPIGGVCGFVVNIGPDGAVYLARWRDHGGIVVIAIDASGELRPGWPVVPDARDGWWDNPQVGSDGTVFILAEPDGGETPSRIAAYSPNGEMRPGWPVTLPGTGNYVMGPEGIVVVWSLIDDRGELCREPRRTLFTLLGPDGRTLPGWPRGSQGHASSPVVDVDGTVYYVSDLGNVYAHARTGEVKPGWPVAVPRAIGWCNRLNPYLAPDGTIFVLGYDEVTDLPSAEVRALAPDGLPRQGWPYRPDGDLVGPPFDSEGGGTISHPVFGPDSTVYLVIFHTSGTSATADVLAIDRDGQVKSGWPYRLPIDPGARQRASLSVAPDGRLFVRAGGMLVALDPDGSFSE